MANVPNFGEIDAAEIYVAYRKAIAGGSLVAY